MNRVQLRAEIHEFLYTLEVDGDEKGWVEYTDAGIYITPKAVDAMLLKVDEYVADVIGNESSTTWASEAYFEGREELRNEQRAGAGLK